MGELDNIYKKLNIVERTQLDKFINVKINTRINAMNIMIDEAKAALEKDNKELRKYYEDENAKTWKRIQVMLDMSLREHHVSPKRMDSIYGRLKELDKRKCLLIGAEQKSEYKILAEDDFFKLFELLQYNTCNNCSSRHDKCELYPLLKKYKIPYSGSRMKCKYGYKTVGKKVV